jgi:hypothetical protein
VKGCRAISLGGIDIDSIGKKRANGGLIPLHNGIGDLACGREGGTDAEQPGERGELAKWPVGDASHDQFSISGIGR